MKIFNSSLILLFGLFAGVQSACDCTIAKNPKELYNNNDSIFVGTAKSFGNNVIATVSWSSKGCFQKNEKVVLLTDSDCPISSPPLNELSLFSGSNFTTENGDKAIILSSCGWNVTIKNAKPADLEWLGSRIVKCEDNNKSEITCANGESPLTCSSCRSTSKCGRNNDCKRNGCDSCASEVFSTGKLTCGADGGDEFQKLCPLCASNPCKQVSPTTLRDQGCPDWQRAATCVPNTCSGCDSVNWFDADGREVCSGLEIGDRCVDWSRVDVAKNCDATETLGYGMLNGKCSKITGCSSENDKFGFRLFESKSECKQSCQCQDLWSLKPFHNREGRAKSCSFDLGYALQNGKCESFEGCPDKINYLKLAKNFYPDKMSCLKTCSKFVEPEYDLVDGRAREWTNYTHSNDTEPQYDMVFDQNVVKRIEIKITEENYNKMEEELKDIIIEFTTLEKLKEDKKQVEKLFSAFGIRRQPGMMEMFLQMMEKQGYSVPKNEPVDQTPAPFVFDPFTGAPMNVAPLYNQSPSTPQMQAQQPVSPVDQLLRQVVEKKFNDLIQDQVKAVQDEQIRKRWEETPIRERGIYLPGQVEYVPCDIHVNDIVWHNVGLRYKGSSSLLTSVQMNYRKRGFRLKFDEFEDYFPDIKNQRFFGFNKLTFSTMGYDNSFVRERLISGVYKEMGLPVASSTYMDVYTTVGDRAPDYWGVYTMFEDPSSSLKIPGDENEGKGNMYKPEHTSWEKFNEVDFIKKNNKKGDFSDIKEVIRILNSPLRSRDVNEWRKQLESVFDVEVFLKTLAVSTAVSNWDTFGVMPHNYYLYNYNGRLTWITWDYNLVLKDDVREMEILLDDVNEEWPLINFLINDPFYRSYYVNILEYLISEKGPLNPDTLISKAKTLRKLVKPRAVQERHPFLTAPEPVELEHDAAWKEMIEYINARPEHIHDALEKEYNN